ncbi:hypothetical protein B0H67DRAFT_644120 [Lasiosphaeris hirsuta]|uniref:SP-RING-type domain-containing protein n=1 Tax=Lasiosphaeris hirsuta TaxID=260670 RepID=A0AA40ARZ6_9PEZI|nr:hypothetical protein B0H67DRAFT_644120 [Lasiosphaeris hirsuta]
MPAQNYAGGPQYPPAIERQIATSNATVNAFVKGSRKRPWMTPGAPKPSDHPIPTRLPQHQSIIAQAVQQQYGITSLSLPFQKAEFFVPSAVLPEKEPYVDHVLTSIFAARRHAQSVLPSPAPSDEPSPAVSNPHDSPNPNPASLPDLQSMSAPTPIHPLTDARFVHDLTIDTSVPRTHDAFGAGGSLSAPSTDVNNSPFLANAQLSPVVHQTAINNMGRPASSASFSGAASASFGEAQHPGFDDHTSAVAPANAAPPFKRRKMDQPPQTSFIPLKYSLFIPKIDQHIQERGGEQALTSNVERPRIQLLREACTNEDGFFLALHQLYCVWSESPGEAHKWIQYPPEIIDKAFTIIEQILKKNQQVAPLTQAWFSRFPEPIARLINPATTYLPMVNQACKFLEKLANNFQPLSKSSAERNYPYLVDELLGTLGCYSPTLQIIFFTASRRRLGVPDGQFGAQMEKVFREDQNYHRSETTGLLVLTPTTPASKQRNDILIRKFKHLIAAAAVAKTQRNARQAFHSPTIHQGSVGQAFNPSTVRQGSSVSSPVPSSGQSPSMIQGHNSSGMLMTPEIMHQLQEQQLHFQEQAHQQLLLQQQPLPHHPQIPHQELSQQHPLAQQQQVRLQQLQQLQQQARQQVQQQQQLQQQARQQVQQQHPQQLQLPSQQLPSQQQVFQQQAAMQQRMAVEQQVQQMHRYELMQMQNTEARRQMLAEASMHNHPVTQTNNVGGLSPSTLDPTMALAGAHMPGYSFNVSFSPSAARAQPPTQQIQHNVYQRPRHLRAPDMEPLMPPKGHQISRPEWPSDPSDKKSIMMSLHQAHVRSPKRVAKAAKPAERYYQAVKSLPVRPVPAQPQNAVQRLYFEVTTEQLALASASFRKDDLLLPVAEHFSGSLRWRVRCCKIEVPGSVVTESQWSILDMSWPPNIFMSLNKQPLSIRRYSHNGKDLPTELTDFIVCGTNVLEVSLPDLNRQSARNRFLAIEMLETLSHSDVVNLVWEPGPTPEEETLNAIKARLTSSGNDDGIIIDMPDLAIDLADPFTSVIFNIPVRGVECTHMECFDLETWLLTRLPSKTLPKCPHSEEIQCGCSTALEPSHPDKWTCPISCCNKDARPYSLRIDGFLADVRKKLEAENKLHTKSIHVRPDGTWYPILQTDDGDDTTDDEDDIPLAARARKASAPPTSVARRHDVEVIEIDD